MKAKIWLSPSTLRRELGIPDNVRITHFTVSGDPAMVYVHVEGDDLPLSEEAREFASQHEDSEAPIVGIHAIRQFAEDS